MNAVEIESAISDLALQPFDAAEFPFSFLAAFGRKDAEIKRLRAGNNNASDVLGGVLLRNNIHIAACDPGSVGETLKALRTSSATTKAKAKFILATDGQTLEAEELITGETITCDYPDFPNHFGFLLPLAGISTIKEIKDNPIDVPPEQAVRRTAEREPGLGQGRASRRHEPLYGASGVLLLCRRHRHFQWRWPVH